MRSSILLASTLLVGALGLPHNNEPLRKRVIVTETAIEVVKVVVTVTAAQTQTKTTGACVAATDDSVVRSDKQSSSKSMSTLTGAAAPVRASGSSSTPKSSSRAMSTSSLKPTSSSTSTKRASSSTTLTNPPTATSSTHISGISQAYLSVGADYQAAILYHHNAARANHDAAPLTWDTACEDNARIAAARCDFVHYIPAGANQGQNLYTTSGNYFNVTAGITESWYKSELPPMEPYFGQSDVPDDVFHKVGHMTQLVWKATTKVGCVSHNCGNNMTIGGNPSTLNKYTVCNYAPAGNVDGRFAVNVVAPISLNNLGHWTD